ncbi:MAG: Gx transporter family protein [Thioalkalispiraceae bacterium]|jgi:heptaprenyl diphosphate synthase
MQLDIQTTRDDHRIAWLSALAITIHLLESVIPSPVPGLKPGFANIITIIVLCQFGLGMAVWVNLLRVLVSSLLLGTFLSPTFMLSLGGALSSLLALALASQLQRQPLANLRFSPMGYSLLAAMAHITGQFVMAYLLFIPHPALWRLFPVLLSFAVLLGTVNGIISQNILKRIT